MLTSPDIVARCTALSSAESIAESLSYRSWALVYRVPCPISTTDSPSFLSGGIMENTALTQSLMSFSVVRSGVPTLMGTPLSPATAAASFSTWAFLKRLGCYGTETLENKALQRLGDGIRFGAHLTG